MAKNEIEKLSKRLDKKLDAIQQVKEFESYRDKLATMAEAVLENEGAKIELELYVKVSLPESEEKTSSADSVLSALRSADSPEDLIKSLEGLDKAVSGEKKKPKYYDLSIKNVDDIKFMKLVDELLSSYKTTIKNLLTKINI